MASTADIREHMEVLGPDGAHVGTLEHVDGECIKLTRSDPGSGGQHRFVPLTQVASVDHAVHLSTPLSDDNLAENHVEVLDDKLDHALTETFPTSDPVSVKIIK